MNYMRKGVIPAILGLIPGLLVVSDFYLTNFLTSLSGYRDPFKIVPFGISAFILTALLIVITVSSGLIRNMTKMIDKADRIFIVLIIIGFQTTGLFPGQIDSTDFLFVLFFIFWFIAILTQKELKIVGSKLHVLNLFLFVCAVMSIINGGVGIVFRMMPLVKAMATSFLIIQIIRSKESVVFFLKTLFVVTTISAIVGIFQEIVFLFNGKILFPFEPKFLYMVIETNSLGVFVRVPAFTGMHLFLGSFLAIGLMIGLNVLLHLRQLMSRRDTLLTITAMFLMTIALVLTLSKTIILGLSIGVLVSLLVKWHSRVIHIAVIALIAAVCIHILGYWKSIYEFLMLDIVIGDISLRVDLMKKGIDGFLYRHPFIGTGVGLGVKYTNNIKGWPTHNAFILAAVETGIFGFLAFCAIYAYGFFRLILTIPCVEDPVKRAVLKILLASLFAYFMNIQFQPDFTSYFNWVLIGFIESAVIVFRNESAIKLQEGLNA